MAMGQSTFARYLDESNRRFYRAQAANGSEQAHRAAKAYNTATVSGPREMTSKYPGKCRNCEQAFPAGTLILWGKDYGTTHAQCPKLETPVEQPAQPTVKAAQPMDAQLAVDLAFAERDAAQRAENLKNLQVGTYRVEFSGRRDTDAFNLKITKDRNNDGAFYFKQRESYEGTGRIWADGRIQFWNNELTAEQQQRAAKALDVLLGAERMGKYAEAYARETGECWRCGRELTLEDSIDRGLGSTCAMKVEAGY